MCRKILGRPEGARQEYMRQMHLHATALFQDPIVCPICSWPLIFPLQTQIQLVFTACPLEHHLPNHQDSSVLCSATTHVVAVSPAVLLMYPDQLFPAAIMHQQNKESPPIRYCQKVSNAPDPWFRISGILCILFQQGPVHSTAIFSQPRN